MIRLTVSPAFSVWRVEKTRWPVSAAWSATDIVSGSRISPTRMTSGSSRRAARSDGEAGRVVADLALADDAVDVLVGELDRVLDRDDVVVPVAVDEVDHRRERGRLAGAGDAGAED